MAANTDTLAQAREALEHAIGAPPRVSEDRMADLLAKAMENMQTGMQTIAELAKGRKVSDPANAKAEKNPLGGELPDGDNGEKTDSTRIPNPSLDGGKPVVDSLDARAVKKVSTSHSEGEGITIDGGASETHKDGLPGDAATVDKNRKGKIATDQPRGDKEGVHKVDTSESDPEGTTTKQNRENVVRPDGKVHKALPPKADPKADPEEAAEEEAEDEAREDAEDAASRKRTQADAGDNDGDGDQDDDDEDQDDGAPMGKALSPEEFVELLAKGSGAEEFAKVVDGSEALAHLTEVVGQVCVQLSEQITGVERVVKALRPTIEAIAKSQVATLGGLETVVGEQRTLAKSVSGAKEAAETLAKSQVEEAPPTGVFFSAGELTLRQKLRKAQVPVDPGTGEAVEPRTGLSKSKVVNTLVKAAEAGKLEQAETAELLKLVDGSTGPQAVWDLLSDEVKAL